MTNTRKRIQAKFRAAQAKASKVTQSDQKANTYTAWVAVEAKYDWRPGMRV